MIMYVPGLKPVRARAAANQATAEARRKMPKLTGESAKRIQPIYGKDYFGIRWADSYVWFQEHGISAFTMNNLQGKTIPMWVDDVSGKERQKNPQIKTRVTASGKTQVLIFRKAAMKGTRIKKYRRNPVTGLRELASDKPASYPGAPGRIGVRESGSPLTSPGRVAGAVARGNVGVRWRHPGLAPRLFLNNGMLIGAQRAGVMPIRVYLGDASWRNFVHGAVFEE